MKTDPSLSLAKLKFGIKRLSIRAKLKSVVKIFSKKALKLSKSTRLKLKLTITFEPSYKISSLKKQIGKNSVPYLTDRVDITRPS